MRAGSFLVDTVHYAPVARLLAGCGVGWFACRKIVTCEVDYFFRTVFFPISQQSKTEILIHEPANFEVLLRGADACSAVDKLVIKFVIVLKMGSPEESKFALRDELGIWPAASVAAKCVWSGVKTVMASISLCILSNITRKSSNNGLRHVSSSFAIA